MNRQPKDITEAAERVYGKLGRGANQDVEAIEAALAAERERCAKIIDDECARVLSKQDGKHDDIDRNIRMVAILLPDLAAAIRGASK